MRFNSSVTKTNGAKNNLLTDVGMGGGGGGCVGDDHAHHRDSESFYV
jgi:hypothetical protein